MANEKMTRKEMFAHIAEVMGNEPEVVEFCEKQIESLNRPRKLRENTAAVEFAERVYTMLEGFGGAITNKDMTDLMNEDRAEDEPEITPQKVAAAFKRLVKAGDVLRVEGEKPSIPTTFVVA